MKAKAPAPPDPKDTSAAQTGTSVATAIANAGLNSVNQVGPDGSIKYTTDGYDTMTDPFTGQSYQIPKRTQTTTLSATGQQIHDQGDQTKLNLANLATSQSGMLQNLLSKPFDGSNDATEARLMELGRKRLDPILAQQDEALRTRLANQGIKAGSAAYDREMGIQGQNVNDANNQLLLQGHNQAYQEGFSNYVNPINIINSLQSGSQVQNPSFGGTPQSTIATTDNAGLINNNYNQKVAAVNAENAATGDVVGGLFGLGSSIIKYSDRQLKKNIIQIGKTTAGYFKYAYQYIFESAETPYHVGYMADEVEPIMPSAVIKIGDYKALNYRLLEAV
jgi:hypothetical protein